MGGHVLLMDGVVGNGLGGRRHGCGGVVDWRGSDQRRLGCACFNVKVYHGEGVFACDAMLK